MQVNNTDIFLKKSNMKWVTFSSNTEKYEIEYEPGVGFYLYVYKNEECVKDYLQDSLEISMDLAQEEYGARKDAWKKVPEIKTSN